MGPTLAVTDGRIISPKNKAILPLLNKLTEKAIVAFSYDNLKRGSLILIRQLCDDDCIAIFSKYDVQIIWHNDILIKGKISDNVLWKIPLSSNQPTLASNPPKTAAQKQMANLIIKVDTTIIKLANYYAATLFNPA